MPTVLKRGQRLRAAPLTRKVRVRTPLKPEATTDDPISFTRGIFERIHSDLIAPERDEQELTWEEREAAGNAELIRIYMDALKRPMSDAEFARAGQIVETLNAHNPGPKCQRQALD